MKRRLILGTLVFFLVFASGAIPARAEMADNLLPMDKAEAMKKMLMEMPPDTFKASVERGEKLFSDTTLGKNSTGMNCAACHPMGGTIGGVVDMEWKGMAMKALIPTLKGAAATFPKAIGPMKLVSNVAGQNNMCIMMFLKGTPLDLNTRAAVDLEAYVYSLSKGAKLTPGKAKKEMKK